MFKENSNLILSDEERAKLKAEFDQLRTIDQKYEFWKTKFDFDYSESYRLEQLSIEDFKIIPQNSTETELLNKRFFKNYFHYFGNAGDHRLEQMKAEFTKSINNSINKEVSVEYELRKIDDYIFSSKHTQHKNSLFGQKYTQFQSEWFFLGYEQYLINKKEFDWTEKLLHPKSINEIFSGIEWAKYREYVKNFSLLKKKDINIQLNGEQKVLALHYLGLGSDIDNATIKAKLFNSFIPELNQETIRGLFSRINDHYKKEQNKDKLLEYFRSIKLNSKARLLEDKIDKLK